MDLRAILMGLAFAAMWSSAFTSARIIVAYAPPMGSLALRFLVSGVIGIAIALAMGQNFRLSRLQWRATLVFGICQNAMYLGLNFVAMRTIEASLASIIASTMPLMVALAGWVFFREKLPRLAVAGLVAGFGGVMVIMGARIGAGVDMFGLTLCMAGAAALTIATLSVRGASSGGNVMMIVGLQMLVGAAILGVASFALEWPFEVQMTTSLVLAFIYTTFVPGLLATFVWFTLVNRIGAVKAATFHFLNPFFGAAVAAVLLKENLGLLDVIGVAIIAAGILAVQLSKQRAPKTPRSTL
ncbi:DMT family transporter [Marinovum sp. 2_MG-2023]|uniref:DMT family transporter n=1 Tax=Roseobacteraceae TaxID=2854170 RepID=UPI001FCFE959|nr:MULTISPECIES: DMT family transporter [Roseobacteraceae]MCJ7872762.1 DMT family transporter [Phaeobacter sp. J2-8]MDO6729982.1 DMT family transporter [Marinovum sp. 2_MG-2023]MDO6779796.1 DMT family transporter [Marinovum sp. 1_MG-2023]